MEIECVFSICLVHHTGLKITANQRTMSDPNGDHTSYTPKISIRGHVDLSYRFRFFVSLQNIYFTNRKSHKDYSQLSLNGHLCKMDP